MPWAIVRRVNVYGNVWGPNLNRIASEIVAGQLDTESDRNMREMIRNGFGLPGLGFGLEFGKGFFVCHSYTEVLPSDLFPKHSPAMPEDFL